MATKVKSSTACLEEDLGQYFKEVDDLRKRYERLLERQPAGAAVPRDPDGELLRLARETLESGRSRLNEEVDRLLAAARSPFRAQEDPWAKK